MMRNYKVSIRNKGSRNVTAENPSEAFAQISSEWSLTPTPDAFNADVCIELLGGKRKSKSYYKLSGKAPSKVKKVKEVPKSREEKFSALLKQTIFREGVGLSVLFPEGYSSFQRGKFRERLFKVFGNPYTSRQKWPVEIRCLEVQLSGIEMLASHVAYDGFRNAMNKFKAKPSSWASDQRSYYNKYLDDFIKVGGTQEEYDKFLEIQMGHYKKSSVQHGVHTDYEGNSYNSISEPNEEINVEAMSYLFACWESLE